MQVSRSGRLAALTVASVAVLFTAACGGGSDAPDADNGGTGNNNGFAAYTECLAKNGITITMPSGQPGRRPSGMPGGLPSGAPGAWPSGMPRPSGGARPGGGLGKPDGVDDATWEKAQTACASLMPSGGPGGGFPGGGFPGSGPSGGPGGGADAAYRNCLSDHGVTGSQSPDAAAAKVCEVLKPPF